METRSEGGGRYKPVSAGVAAQWTIDSSYGIISLKSSPDILVHKRVASLVRCSQLMQ